MSSPEYKKQYYQDHRVEILERGHRNYFKRKQIVLAHYGINGVANCVRCGNGNIGVLTIDHINGGGNAHRKQIGGSAGHIYYWLMNQYFPEGYQTMCMNCQWLKRTEDREQYERDR
jgi:hypothetical protein